MRPEVQDSVVVSVEPLAVHIDVAAQMIGISRKSFYSYFIDTRRLVPVYVGTRAMIDVGELRAAWLEYASGPQRRATERPADSAEA